MLLAAIITTLTVISAGFAVPVFLIAHHFRAERLAREQSIPVTDRYNCGVSYIRVDPGPTKGTEIVSTQYDCDHAREVLHTRPTLALGTVR